MKRILAAAQVGVILLFVAITAFAQETARTTQGTDRLQGSAGWDPSSRAEGTGGTQPIAGLPSLDNNQRQRWVVPREDRVLKKGLLAPSADDRAAFEAFLQEKNTGLMRLLPREVYDSQTYHTEKKLNIRGGGAYYSFGNLTHRFGYGSDIELDHNKLSVGFSGADYGLLTNIGDTSLELITLDDPWVQPLLIYKPAKSEAEVRLNSYEGVTLDGVLYHKRLPVQENSTYLLRSIVYDESDLLVAFRVVRKDTDGSVIIVWKRLKKYSVPQLTR
ncbi:MAG TPA: hypothetical protein VGJ55_16135 [Pyrinomonadaceae bacterium]